MGFGQAIDMDEDGIEESEDMSETIDIPDFCRGFKDNSQVLAKKYIAQFFDGKQMYCGGAIPQSVLNAPGFVRLVLNTDICTGVDQAYQLMELSGGASNEQDESNVSEDTRLVVDILQECNQKLIPKQFAAGITLMHLAICCGMELPRSLTSQF